jgi:hypothetical protein
MLFKELPEFGFFPAAAHALFSIQVLFFLVFTGGGSALQGQSVVT